MKKYLVTGLILVVLAISATASAIFLFGNKENNKTSEKRKIERNKNLTYVEPDKYALYKENGLNYEETEEIINNITVERVTFSGLKDKTIEKQINKEVNELIDKILNEIKSFNSDDEININVNIEGNFSNILSLAISSYVTVNDNYQLYYEPYNVDLTTGKPIFFCDLFLDNRTAEQELAMANEKALYDYYYDLSHYGEEPYALSAVEAMVFKNIVANRRNSLKFTINEVKIEILEESKDLVNEYTPDFSIYINPNISPVFYQYVTKTTIFEKEKSTEFIPTFYSYIYKDNLFNKNLEYINDNFLIHGVADDYSCENHNLECKNLLEDIVNEYVNKYGNKATVIEVNLYFTKANYYDENIRGDYDFISVEQEGLIYSSDKVKLKPTLYHYYLDSVYKRAKSGYFWKLGGYNYDEANIQPLNNNYKLEAFKTVRLFDKNFKEFKEIKDIFKDDYNYQEVVKNILGVGSGNISEKEFQSDFNLHFATDGIKVKRKNNQNFIFKNEYDEEYETDYIIVSWEEFDQSQLRFGMEVNNEN